MQRCDWCLGDTEYEQYHDTEWGVPCHDEQTLFELLLLEGAQAGLSWITILRKRDNYRRCFDGFDADRMARYTPQRVARLLQDPGIVRNRLKVEAAVSNAKALLTLQQQGSSLHELVWGFVDGRPVQHLWRRQAEVPATTPQSDAMSKALKKAGFTFVGATICYAFMQAAGLVNDHLVACDRHAACARLAADPLPAHH